MGSHLENQDQLDDRVGAQVLGAVVAVALLFTVLILLGLGNAAKEMEREDAPGGGEEFAVHGGAQEMERHGMERQEVDLEVTQLQETERQDAGTDALWLWVVGGIVAYVLVTTFGALLVGAFMRVGFGADEETMWPECDEDAR